MYWHKLFISHKSNYGEASTAFTFTAFSFQPLNTHRSFCQQRNACHGQQLHIARMADYMLLHHSNFSSLYSPAIQFMAADIRQLIFASIVATQKWLRSRLLPFLHSFSFVCGI